MSRIKGGLAWIGVGVAGMIIIGVIGSALDNEGDQAPTDRTSETDVERATATATPRVGVSKMRTDAGRSFYQSIERNIEARDISSVTIACEAARARLAKSRSNDEIYDWLDLLDACYEAVAGNWTQARDQLP